MRSFFTALGIAISGGFTSSVEADAAGMLKVSLGYSFSAAQFDTKLPSGRTLLGDTTGNEPLASIWSEIGGRTANQAEFLLAFANFGQLISTSNSGGVDSSSAVVVEPDVRRSLLVDLSVRRGLGGKEPVGFLTLNGGFVFDVEKDDEGTEVPDVSSYLFLGPALKTIVGTDSKRHAHVSAELLVGQSEVMSGGELFSRSWGDSRTLRIRPKLTFTLLEGGTPVKARAAIGVWGDAGFDEGTGDTVVLFISRPVWETDSR